MERYYCISKYKSKSNLSPGDEDTTNAESESDSSISKIPLEELMMILEKTSTEDITNVAQMSSHWGAVVRSRPVQNILYVRKLRRLSSIITSQDWLATAFDDELKMIAWLIENHATLHANPSPPSAIEESHSFLLDYDNYHTHAVAPRPHPGNQAQWVAERIQELNQSREFILYNVEDGDKFLEVMIQLNIAVRTTYM